MTTILLFFLFILFLIYIFCATKLTGTSLNPATTSLLPFTLAFFNLSFDPFNYYYYPISTIVIILFGLYGTMLFLPSLFLKKGELQLSEYFPVNQDFKLLRNVTLILFLISYLAFYLKILKVFARADLPLSLEFFDRVKKGGVILVLEKHMKNGWSLLHYTGYLGLFYSSYIFAKTKKIITLPNILLVLFSSLYLVTLLLLFIKVQIIIAILFICFTYSLFNGRYWKSLVVSFLSLAFLITLLDNLMYSNDLRTAFEFFTRYISGSIIGFDRYFHLETTPQVFGAKTLEPFYMVFRKIGFPIDYYHFKQSFVINNEMKEANSGTILIPPYLDFGIIGIITFNILLSTFSWASMAYFNSKHSLRSGLIYSLVLTTLFLSFIGSVYKHIEFFYIFTLHLLLEFCLFSRFKRTQSQQAASLLSNA